MKEATIKININTKNAIGSIDELNNEFNGTLSTINDLRIASQKLSEELESTPVGTDKFKQLQSALIDVNGQLKNYELSVEALDNEQFASEIRSVVGGVMDLVGGLTLLGVSDDNIEKIAQKFAKLEGISRAATGAMDIYNSGIKVMNSILTKSAAAQEVLAAATAQSSVANVANAGTTTAVGVASTGAAVKIRALTAAMLANPWTAIAVGIAAVVSALMLFGDEEEDASDKTDKLTKSLDRQNAAIDRQYKSYRNLWNILNREGKVINDRSATLAEAEIKRLESIENRTVEQTNKLKEEYEKLAQARNSQIDDNAQAATTELNLEKMANDERLAALRESQRGYFDLFVEARKDGRQADAIAFEEKAESITKEIKQFQDRNKEIGDILKKDSAGLSLIDREAENESLKVFLDLKDSIKKIDEEELKRKLDLEKERRKILLDGITDDLNRIKSANDKRTDLEANLIDNLKEKELELQKIKTGKEVDDLLNQATQRELKINEEKFLNLKISQEDYERNKLEIAQKGIANLNDAEKKYYDKVIENNDKVNNAIKKRFEDEAKITIAEKDLILAQTLKLETDYAKEIEILNAEKIQDVDKRDSEILKINEKYLQKEKANFENVRNAELKLLEETYKVEISNVQLTEEQKAKITAKYNQDKIKIQKDTEKAIIESEKTITDTVQEEIQKRFDLISKWVSAISSPITQALDVINTAFDMISQRTQKSIDDAYNKGTEMYNKMYGEQLISREEYENKLEILEEQKREREKALAMKQWKITKANNIANATSQGAQAVLNAYTSGASIPPLGPVTTGPLFAGIAAALAATQIGLIASQKFQAARGGLVPGQPSKVDSVDALLAPGEMVINSNSSQMFGGLLSAINEFGGGIPLAPSTAAITSSNQSNIVYVENKQQGVVKAYVVESELSKTTSRVDRLRNSASF